MAQPNGSTELAGSRPKTSIFLLHFFLFVCCVHLYVCRLCINFQDLCASLLGKTALLILLLIFISHFVIDFLSIRKVIIFSAIATDYRHPPTVMFYTPKCCKLHDDSFPLYCAIRGVRKTYCARSRNDVRPLTTRSNGKPSKKTMESLEDVCSCRNCSKARPHVSR